MSNIIGLVGFAGSGKDTVGNVLCDLYGYKKYSMAKPLKDVVSLLFSWDRELIEGSTDESRLWREQPDEWWNEKLNWEERFGVKFTPRICLQVFGTDVLRNHFDSNIWVICLERYLTTIEDDRIVITDCRFKNEIDVITKLKGKIIRVRRNSDPEWFSEIEQINKQQWKDNIYNTDHLSKYNIHESEVGWVGADFSHIIENDKDIESLRISLSNIF